MKLETVCPCRDLLDQAGSEDCVPCAEGAEIHRKATGSVEHPLDVPGSWRAGGGSRPGRRPCPAAQHRGEAGIECLLDLLWANEVDMHVDAAGGDYLAFAPPHLRSPSHPTLHPPPSTSIPRFPHDVNTP